MTTTIFRGRVVQRGDSPTIPRRTVQEWRELLAIAEQAVADRTTEGLLRQRAFAGHLGMRALREMPKILDALEAAGGVSASTNEPGNEGEAMPLTAEIMEQEAQAVAEGVADIIEAGMDPDLSVSEKVGELISAGYQTFGDVTAGLDDDANRARFGLEVAAKTMDVLVSRLLPLTETE